MKDFFVVAVVAVSCAATALSQSGVENSPPSDVFEIGTRKVRIPAPEGFTKIGLRHGRMLSVQQAAEPAQNEILAVHLPVEEPPNYSADFDRQPDFFTKVSVSRVGRNENVTAAGFEALASYIEQEFSRMTDPDDKKVIAGQQYVSKNMSDLLDSKTKIKWDRPINLGVFEKNAKVHSTLALLSLSANKTPYRFLGTISFVYVNMRLIYVYAYKSDPVEEDLEMLRVFTRKWTASIIAANEEITAKSR